MATHKQQLALPLHLTLSMLPLLLSQSALQASKSGSTPWKASHPSLLPEPLAKLSRAWEELQNNRPLARAVEAEAKKRTAELLTGVQNYNQSGSVRDIHEPSVALTLGSARLLDYGCDNIHAPVVFLIPSLINRYYIMDLTRRLSFARFLRDNGAHVFIIDWGQPSKRESHFNTALYVTETLVPIAEWIRANTKGQITLGGYCMGGLLALALACVRPDLVDNLGLFSTPWDFTATNFPRFAMKQNEIENLREYIHSRDEIPAELIQMMFHFANPYAFQSKFREFAVMDKDSPATQDFIAIEDWANDGVTMTRGVAEDCLIGWIQHNQPFKKQWRVGGQIIDPEKLDMPCFVAAPQDDKIVPSDCALPLVQLLKNASLIEPKSGHVSMMAGRHRKSALWEPFYNWLEKLS